MRRVSWASGDNLCQVKFFLSEDCHSKVGLQVQDCQQAKTWMSCSNNVYSDNHHSGFDGRYSMDAPKEKPSCIAQIKWRCPPEFILSCNWHVASGEESEEAQTQRHREMRVLETVYLRPSDIPPSPSPLLDVQDDHLDDIHVPRIPITPIEEGALDFPSDESTPQNASLHSHSLVPPKGLLAGNPIAPICDDTQASIDPSASDKPAPEVLPGSQADLVIAVVAAIIAITKSKEQGSLIDTNLLIKFLSDPKMIEKLISEQEAPVNTKIEPISTSKSLTVSVPVPSNKPCLVEEVINEDGTPTYSSKPDPVIKKLINEPVAATKVGAAPISRSKPAIPSVALPGPRPGPVLEKLIEKYRAATDTRASPISGSKLVTPLVAFPGPNPDRVIKKLIQKHRKPTDIEVVVPDSGSDPVTSSIAVPSTRYVPVVKKLIHENGFPTSAGSAPFSSGKQVTPLASLPSSKRDVVKIKRMINEHGLLDCTSIEPISRSKPLNPRPDAFLPSRMNANPLPKAAETGSQMHVPPVKDFSYMKSLIRQHGDLQETQDCNLPRSGNFDVHLQDLKLVPNESTSKVQKPCIFFKSPKGCRYGSNCTYRHDKTKQVHPICVMEAPSTKRVRLGREITGRT
ncbi:hypothetical protein U1Q18_040114 [Sarracenia purpurea var. burkii]